MFHRSMTFCAPGTQLVYVRVTFVPAGAGLQGAAADALPCDAPEDSSELVALPPHAASTSGEQISTARAALWILIFM